MKKIVDLVTTQESPLTTTALAMLSEQAGLPKGVLNIVHGDTVALGECLSTHEKVDKISFTGFCYFALISFFPPKQKLCFVPSGSTRVGRILMAAAANTVKRLSLELGGDAPVIVLEDADIELAATKAGFSRFRNGGQTCICANRMVRRDNAS